MSAADKACSGWSVLHDIASLCEDKLSHAGHKRLFRHLAHCSACRAIKALLVPDAQAERANVARDAHDDGLANAGQMPRAEPSAGLAPPKRELLPGFDLHVRNGEPLSERRHVVLFVAANPQATSRVALGRDCAEIQRQLDDAQVRGRLRFEVRWAATDDDLGRHLRELQPTVVHFSGHGGDVALRGADGRPLAARALAAHFAASASTRLVVLNACRSTAQAEALHGAVDCVVGMPDDVGDAAAHAFAVGLYGRLGHRQPIRAAVVDAVNAVNAQRGTEMGFPLSCTSDDVSTTQLEFPCVPSAGSHDANARPRKKPRRPRESTSFVAAL